MKRVITFILSIWLLTALISNTVKAATTYDLKVGNVQVTSDNASKITGSYISSGYCKYNNSTKTLTFVDAVINMGKSGYPAVECGMNSLIIEFEGDYNKVRNETAQGFKLTGSGNYYFKGRNNSKLVIDMAGTAGYNSGIDVGSGGGNIFFNQMEVDFESSNRNGIALYGNNKAKATIQESKMAVYSGTSSFPPFYGFNDISLRSCYSSNATLQNGNFYYSNGNLLKGEVLFIFPTLSIGRYKINTERMATFTSSDIPAISQGTIGYDPSSKVLMMNNAIINSDQNYDGISENIENLTIKLYGTNGISTNTDNYAIRANQAMTISGENATSSSLAILAQKGIFMLGNKLTVENASLALVAGSDLLRGYWGSSLLVLNKCKLTAYTNEGTSAIYGFRDCQMIDCYVISPERAYYNLSKKAFVTSSGGTLNELTIDTPSDYYPVTILGNQIHSLNKDNFTCDGLSGTVKYDPETRTLSVDNATITGTGDNYGIAFTESGNYNLAISGTNTITTLRDAIYSTGNLTITGSGSLAAKSTSNNGVTSKGDLTLNANAKLSFDGQTMGINCNVNKKMYVNYVDSKTDYYTKGIDGSAYYGPPIQFQEMDFCSHPSYGTPGCYYDTTTKMVCQNGGNVVKDDNTVNFYHVSTKYGIIVGGTAVNNANRQGVGSPYITKGGGTAVSYDSNSSTLTLDGAEIKMDASARLSASLIESNKDGLKIKVQSNSRLECPSSSSAKENVLLNAKTTITGSGKLTVSTGNVRSSISPYENLVIKDANIETSGGIYCSASGKSLTVNNSTVKVNAGGIGGFSNLSLEGGTKITEPKNGRYNGSYVVNSSGSIAETVILSNGSSLKGDVNLDGNVDISDVVAVINTMAGSTTYKATADVNADTKIDISDVVAVINIMAGQ